MPRNPSDPSSQKRLTGQRALRALATEPEYLKEEMATDKGGSWKADRTYFDAKPGFALSSVPEFVPGGPEGLPLTLGLHLISAPAGGGKTLTGLGLATWLDALGIPTEYIYAYEPGAVIRIDSLDAPRHEKLLSTKARRDKYGVLVFDSLSMAIRMLKDVAPLATVLGDQAYTGGLKAADLAGAAMHNNFAVRNGLCLFATVNSEMLPIVKALSGAVMGTYVVTSPGSLSGIERSERQQRPIVIPHQYMNIASLALGYGTFGARRDKPLGRL